MKELAVLLKALGAFVPLFQTILWLLIILVGGYYFRSEIKSLYWLIKERIEAGSHFKVLGMEFSKKLKSLPKADPIDTNQKQLPLSSAQESLSNLRNEEYKKNHGLFIGHVLWPSKADGQNFDVYIFLIKHKSTDFSDVQKAEFFLGHMWGDQIFEKRPENGLIGLRTSAYGPFLCICRVTLKNGETVLLSRYIDFEMGNLLKREMIIQRKSRTKKKEQLINRDA